MYAGLEATKTGYKNFLHAGYYDAIPRVFANMKNQRGIVDHRRGNYKRWYDITTLVLAHTLLLPFWPLLWSVIPLLIWLGDRGHVFYKQERFGKDRRVFTILKFQTLLTGADHQGPG